MKKELSALSEQIRGQMTEIQKTKRETEKDRGGRADRKKESKRETAQSRDCFST